MTALSAPYLLTEYISNDRPSNIFNTYQGYCQISLQVKLSSDNDPNALVVSGGHSQSGVVAVPVERVDWLRADHHALETLQRAWHAASHAFRVDAVTLFRVFAENKLELSISSIMFVTYRNE